MTGAPDACPSIADIERIASGEAPAPETAAHVESCPACRERLDNAREDARFLTRVRTLGRDAMGPEGAPRVPGYRVLSLVSTGAQGAVFRAVQEATSRTVAIKVLSPGPGDSARRRARAEREAEIAARLRHPNVVTVFESRVLPDGRPCVVMEFVDGVALDAWSPPGDSPEQRHRALLDAFISVCAGIHHAHLNGVIHRDLKPENILVNHEGRPVVLDFGIAKIGGLHSTRTGEFAGTPAYASPEQVAGRPDDVDALTDIYSLGVILYRLVCRAMPYEVEGSIFDIARTIEHTEPVRPRDRSPSIHPDLEAVVLCAIRKDKSRRYQSAAALAADLERYLAGQAVEARAGSGWYLLRKAVAVNRGRLALAAAAAVTLLVAVVAVAVSVGAARDAARREALQRESAHLESIRARAVTELLRSALPAPQRAPRPISRGIIDPNLGRLYFRVESGAFADDPDLDQTIRRLWGAVYTAFSGSKSAGQVEYAEVSLRNGLVRLRSLHPGPHPETAAAMHELAGVLLLRRRAPEAERECRAVIAMREALGGPDAAPAAESRALLARILLALDRPDEALAEAGRAAKVLALQPGAADSPALLGCSRVEARVLLTRNDLAQAEPVLLSVLTARLRRLPPEDTDLLASLDDAAEFAERSPGSALARTLAQAWGAEPADAPALVRRDLPILRVAEPASDTAPPTFGRAAAVGRLIALQEAILGPNDPALVGSHIERMRAALYEREWDLHTESALRAAEILTARFGPNDFAVLLCLEQAGNMLMYAGGAERAVDINRRACAIWDALPTRARDRLLAANHRRRLALSLVLCERYDEGLVECRRAIDEFLTVVDEHHHIIALTRAQVAVCLAHAGAVEEADAVSATALADLDANPAAAPDQKAHAAYIRGRVLHLAGRPLEARPYLERAWAEVYRVADPAYAWRRDLITRYADILDGVGETDLAQDWRARIAEDGDTIDGLPR